MSRYIFPLDSALTEYVFTPFFDPEHSHGVALKFDMPDGVSMSRENDWCFTRVLWQGTDANQSQMTIDCLSPFSPESHDRLIATFTLSQTATISFALIGLNGNIVGGWSQAFAGTGIRQEISLSLKALLFKGLTPRGCIRAVGLRSKSFSGIALRIDSPHTSEGVLVLTWIGVRNHKAHSALLNSRTARHTDWSPWILPPRDRGDAVPKFGILFGKEELLQVRKRLTLPGWQEHFAFLEKKAAQCLERDPERDYGEYLPNQDLRFTRVRANAVRAYHWDALVLAFVGLVKCDQHCIEHALRYLMCMLHTPQWADSAEQRISSSTWTQRAFMEEMTTTSIAILVDWLGFSLSEQAQSLARQALWTRGISYVQRDLFQYEYMHKMNQGAVFCRALVLGGLVIEQGWPRAKNVADDAYTTMKRVLQSYVQNDGGIAEGPGYFCQTLTATLWTIIAYGRARNLDWRSEVESLFPNIDQYLQVMAAGEPGKCIPSGDCRLEWFSGDGIPILAALFPDSAFSGILKPCLQNGWIHEVTGTLRGSGGMIGMVYGPDQVKPPRYIAAYSSWLPKTGKLSHVQELDSHRTRLWASTSQHGMTHGHLDHGSIALEIDTVPVFVDRGMAEYWKAAVVQEMRRSFAHNTLTPLLADGHYADQAIPSLDAALPVTPVDGNTLLHIPSQDVWRDYMSSYTRSLAKSDVLTAWKIQDTGTLRVNGRVAFHLHSPHKFSIQGTSVEAIIGGVGCKVDFPWANSVTVISSLPDFADREIFHICAISTDCVDFDFETQITLLTTNPKSEI